MYANTFQLNTLVFPSNVVDMYKLDCATSVISFRAPGTDKIHETIISSHTASKLARGHSVIVHHTPDPIHDINLRDKTLRKANIRALDQISTNNIHVFTGNKWKPTNRPILAHAAILNRSN